jgi:class 3 adenylate cyclase
MAQPDLVERWRRVQTEGEPEGPLLAEMNAHLRRQGVDPTAILVFGHGGWHLATFSPDLGEVARSSLPLVLDGFAREILGPVERAGALAAATVGRMQALHARRPELKRQIKAPMPVVPAMGLDANTDYLRRHVGEVQELYLGQRCFTFFFDLLPGRATPTYAPFILWNHQLTARRYLAEAVPEAWLGFLRERGAGLDLAAFQQEGSQWKPVSIAGDGEGLVEWAQACEQRVLFSSAGGAEILAVPLKGLPGFVLVVRLSLAPLQEILWRERSLWGAIMLSLLGLTVLGGYGLSRWLAGPVVGMTAALQQVTGGDLAVRIPCERADELGQAAATLDTMITWLRERERLLPFVSAKALEATGSGNLFAAGIGSVQTVAVLVSDIRSFTTLTETHPPAAIFEALNEHLAAMAAEVQAGGGQIDRFVGDAVWAVFFAEAGRPPVEAAVAAARAMMRRHAALNARRQAAGRFPFAIGVGLEVGEVVVGILGDPGSRLDFTMIGEAVSEAARWEAASKLGTRSRIVASARVVAALPVAEQACWHRLPVPEDIYEREADPPPGPEAAQDRPEAAQDRLGAGQGPTGGAAAPRASLPSDRDGGGSA